MKLPAVLNLVKLVIFYRELDFVATHVHFDYCATVFYRTGLKNDRKTYRVFPVPHIMTQLNLFSKKINI